MVKRKEPRASSGFIVHPFETGNSKYHASYGNHNKTSRSFTTLNKAKEHLKRKGIKKALYDSPSGTKSIMLDKSATKKLKRRTTRSLGFGGLYNF